MEKQNVSVYAGDSHNIRAGILDQDNGLKPLQLAGAELTWILYREPHSQEVLTKTTEAGGIIVEDASEGRIVVKLLATDTAPLKPGTAYRHVLKVRDSLNQVTTVLTGDFRIKN